MKPRARGRLVLWVVAAVLAGSRSGAADYEFQYDVGLTWFYTQDFLRTGNSDNTDDFSTARFGAGFLAKTPRSLTTVRYSPEYIRYDREDVSDQVDHRLGTSWHLQTGPLSDFEIRQGLSETSRQTGFTDYAGLGGNPSEPVTVTSRRVVWDVVPRLTRVTSQATTITLEALYREESYDLPTLIDSRQAGIQGGIEKRVGRNQFLAGSVRADEFRFGTLVRPAAGAFDRFIRAQASWGRRIDLRMSVHAGVGAYRSSGPQVESVVRPTLDVGSDWSWSQVYLSVAYELSYSSGGGISTSNRSQWAHVGLTGTWGAGFQAGTDLGYIYRASPTATLGEERPLTGWSTGLHLSKRWLTGMGMIVRLSRLRQERVIGPDLSYQEAMIGVTYAPPVREQGPPPPSPSRPGGRSPRTPPTP